jgi:hypothetical protein
VARGCPDVSRLVDMATDRASDFINEPIREAVDDVVEHSHWSGDTMAGADLDAALRMVVRDLVQNGLAQASLGDLA